jgi:hypothetical protein
MPWNQKKNVRGLTNKTLRMKKIILPVFLISSISASVFIILNNKTKEVTEEIETPKVTKKIKNTLLYNKTYEISSANTNKTEEVDEIQKIRAMTPTQKLDYLYKLAQKKKYTNTPRKGRTFSSGVEQVMSWIFTTRLGDLPPPLPQLSIYDEVHLAEIIINKNEINENDNESTKYCKEMVTLAKKELIQYIKEGGDITGFLTYYRDQLKEAYHSYNSARRMVLEAYRTESDRELCDLYLNRINEELSQKGIKKITISDEIKQKLSIQKMKGNL